MRIERRDKSVFIAHNRGAIFVNRGFDNEKNKPFYLLRANKGLSDLQGSETTQWITIIEMRIESDEIKDFLEKLTELAK